MKKLKGKFNIQYHRGKYNTHSQFYRKRNTGKRITNFTICENQNPENGILHEAVSRYNDGGRLIIHNKCRSIKSFVRLLKKLKQNPEYRGFILYADDNFIGGSWIKAVI